MMGLQSASSSQRDRQAGVAPEVDDLVRLRTQRQLARRHLHFLKTLADFDIACEIGLHELMGTPLTVKQLMLLDIAPAVTVFRRLHRLCTFGAVLRTRSNRDRRVHELRLTPEVHRLFALYLRVEQVGADLRVAAPGSAVVVQSRP